MSDEVPYEHLTPDVIMTALERIGFECTGSILALGSYENRVYQIGTEEGFVVAKFYRPGRWTTDAILEEHDFALELAEQEIPVVAPLIRDGGSLHEHDDYRFAVYERRGGRWPELGTSEDRVWMGRFLGRLHAVGAQRRFEKRKTLSRDDLGRQSVDQLLSGDWIPPHLQTAYESLTADLLNEIHAAFGTAQGVAEVRLHGDCHRGNVLWTDVGPHFVDLDDCLMGPAVQDLWMLLSGSRREMSEQLTHILEGYSHFATFDGRELVLVESLRTLRMIHYSAWLARRWSDPAFPAAFPWFIEPRYWENQILALREQLAAIAEGPLEL